MHRNKPSLAVLLFSLWLFAACAATPEQPGTAEHIRNSIYHFNQGSDLFARGCYQRAMDYFQDAHQLFSAADDQAGAVRALNSMGDTFYRMGDLESALRVYGDAVVLARNEIHPSGLSRALNNLAAVRIELGRLEEAAAALDSAQSVSQTDETKALHFKTRALWWFRKGEMSQAQTFLAAAFTACDDADDHTRSSIHYAMGQVLLEIHDPEQARARFQEALDLDRAHYVPHDIARDLEGIARTYRAAGDYGRAVNYFTRSAKIYALLNDHRRTQAAVVHLEESARLADIDIATTLFWIRTWLADKAGGAICD